jgi:hypothetical protein
MFFHALLPKGQTTLLKHHPPLMLSYLASTTNLLKASLSGKMMQDMRSPLKEINSFYLFYNLFLLGLGLLLLLGLGLLSLQVFFFYK